MAGVVAALAVDADRMRAALYGGFAQAADLAEHLMATLGLDYRSAYDLVGAAVRRADAEGRRGGDLTGVDLEEAAVEAGITAPSVAGLDLTSALDPEAIVRGRHTRGGAAPDVVRGMAKEGAAAADAVLSAVRTRRDGFAAAEDAVLAQAAALVKEE